MSKKNKLNIEEKLPIIKNLINNQEPDIKPNIITVYTISKCFNISFIESVILLNQYVLNESDLSNYAIFFICETVDDSGSCFSKKIISSCEPNINQILEDKKHTLSYGVFGICNLNEYYLMEDYHPFIGENTLITRFDFSDVPQNIFASLNEPTDSNYEKKELKTKNNKPSTKEENKKITKKDNIILEKEEENYYGNFQPIKKAKTDKDKINLNGGENLKRKKRGIEDDEKSEKDHHHKKNRNNKEFKEDADTNLVKKNKKFGSIKEENKDEDIQMKDNTEESQSQNVPKKIKKIRKIKKNKRFLNEEGYMVTKDIEVEEEYWSDEKPEKKVVKNNYTSQESKPNKNKKKVNKGQTTISSFFKK